MALDFDHRGDHVAVTFAGELTVPSVLELVNLIDSLVDTYFYTRVDLTISSPGGMIQAANPFLSALSRWRARGVVLCTRVYSNCESLGAVVFSVGDHRVADPNARLFFHGARVAEASDITAGDTVRMYMVLRHLDKRLVKLLADRALRVDPDVLPALSHPSDSSLVSVLVRALSLGDGAGEPLKAGVRALARYVQHAVRTRDRRSLKRLYRYVLKQEVSVSSYLACTLGLADAISDPETVSVDYEKASDSAPALIIPEWRLLYPPFGAVPRADITRHVLALGETGSGKTFSAILPVVAAMARAPHEEVRGGLIIDPKCELAPVVRSLVGDGLQHLDPSDLVIDLMDTPQWRLDEDLTEKRWVSAAMKIMLRMRGFALASPLRVIGPHAAGGSNAEFFDREGCGLLRDVIAFILMLLDPEAPPVSEWLPSADLNLESSAEEGGSEPSGTSSPNLTNSRHWVLALQARARGADGERGVNVAALASWALGSPLVQAEEDALCLWTRLAAEAAPTFGSAPGEGRDLLHRVSAYWRKSAEVRAQHMGVVASARNAVCEFADPSVENVVYFGCEPGLAMATATRVDFPRLVACGPPEPSSPRFVLYQPARDGADSLVAACLKATFFERLFLDADRRTGRPDLPLVAYAADEAHRFVTCGPSGEAHFIDAARSFGCVALIATQSLAGIEHALEQGGGSSIERRAATDVLWVNTGTKLVFRSTDERAADRVQEMAPYRPGYAPITRVRPLSALSPGGCYAFLPDGSFQLAQLDPFDPDAPARGHSSALIIVPPPAPRRRKKRKRNRSGARGSVKAGKRSAREEVSS